jgi:glucan phosphoethanolaminetransferase (alkaline phosphatase superfamily)
MPDRFSRETKLAAFLVLAAISPIVSWYMLLFTAKPTNVSVAVAAWSELTYVFSRANADMWWFVLWALLPLVLLTTAIACYRNRPLSVRALRMLAAVGLVFAGASAYLWPVELFPIAGAICLAYPRRVLPDRSAAQ